MKKFRYALLAASAAALALATTTLAGSGAGDVFNLGQTNTVNVTSKLAGTVAGPQLAIENDSTDPAASGLSIAVPSGVPPLKVSSQKLITNLNADLLGGKRLGQLPYWNLRGNAATTSLNFLGTTDAKPLVFKTNNTQAVYLDTTQNMSVTGTTTSFGGVKGLRGTTSCSGLFAVGGCGSGNTVFGVFGRVDTPGPVAIGVEGRQNTVGCPVETAGVAGCSGFFANPASILEPSSVYVGVRGIADSGVGVSGGVNSGRAVEGITTNGIGVYGTSSGSDGVYGHSAPIGAAGVHGDSTNGDGVLGTSTNGPGVYGFSQYGSAAYFEGDVTVSGTLYAGKKQFRIDDPLDPAHKYLQHTSVESSDMLDVYTGNVRTDAHGFATVRLPAWFQALNRSFRYQLTILGHAPWDTQARVWDEIAHNRFTIRTNRPGVRVSWQVTGIRHDAYANAHRTQVVVPKAAADQGKYLYGQLYGKPQRAAIGRQPLGRER